MTKKIVIDQELCIGCGACVNLCPDAFELQHDGKSKAIIESGCGNCDCDMVTNSCPVGAIKIIDL